MPDPRERRLVRVEYSVPLLARASSGTGERDWWRVQNPLPADAVFLWAYMAPDGRSVSFVFEHDSFELTPEGAAIPGHVLMYESRRIMGESAE